MHQSIFNVYTLINLHVGSILSVTKQRWEIKHLLHQTATNGCLSAGLWLGPRLIAAASFLRTSAQRHVWGQTRARRCEGRGGSFWICAYRITTSSEQGQTDSKVRVLWKERAEARNRFPTSASLTALWAGSSWGRQLLRPSKKNNSGVAWQNCLPLSELPAETDDPFILLLCCTAAKCQLPYGHKSQFLPRSGLAQRSA